MLLINRVSLPIIPFGFVVIEMLPYKTWLHIMIWLWKTCIFSMTLHPAAFQNGISLFMWSALHSHFHNISMNTTNSDTIYRPNYQTSGQWVRMMGKCCTTKFYILPNLWTMIRNDGQIWQSKFLSIGDRHMSWSNEQASNLEVHLEIKTGQVIFS